MFTQNKSRVYKMANLLNEKTYCALLNHFNFTNSGI